MDNATFRDLGYRLVDAFAAALERCPQEPVYRPLAGARPWRAPTTADGQATIADKET